MPSLIPPPLISPTSSPEPSLDQAASLLPPFLAVSSRITHEHNGTYHKGYLVGKPCSTFRFSFKTRFKKKHEDWCVDLPDLLFNWVDLCTEGILLSGHVAHLFICMSTSSSPTSPSPTTFDPVASIVVSAVNLNRDCHPNLLQAFASSHSNHNI